MDTSMQPYTTVSASPRDARVATPWRRFTPALFVVLFAAAACDKDGESVERDDSAARTAAAAPTSGTVSTSANAALTVPPAVEALGHFAEDAYDQAKLGQWTRAQTAVDSLRAAVGSLTAAPGRPSPSVTEVRTSVDALAQSITAKDRAAALRDANQLTAVGARLSETYHPQFPAEVTMLDFYGRELEIWSDANDLPKLQGTSTAMRRSWDAVRPAVLAHGGAAESAQFEALVRRVEAAKTPDAFGATATPVLDAVDVLEAVFRR